MSVIYLLTEGTKASLQTERIVLKKEKEVLWTIPVTEVDNMVVGRHAQVTTQAIHAIIMQGGFISYVNNAGKVYGTLGDETVSLKKFRAQLQNFEMPEKQLVMAKFVITKKLRAQRKLLFTYHKSNLNPKIKDIIKELDQLIKKVKSAETIEKVRGFEGVAAQKYFDSFGTLISVENFIWTGRYKHPAPDPVNAMLSFGYSFLEREVRIAIASFGADARIGFLHSNNERKDSLVFDLMEMFRASVSDRLVLKLLNRNQIKFEHFTEPKGRVLFTEDGKKIWCEYYEKFMQKELNEFKGVSPRTWIRKQVRQFLKDNIKAE